MLSKLKYFLFLSVLCVAVKSQAQSTYNKYFTSGSISLANNILVDLNNNPIITSYYKDSATFGQQGLDLKKLDANGNVLQRKRYLFGSVDYLSAGNNKNTCDISAKTSLQTGAGFTGTTSTLIFVSVNKNTLDTNWAKTYKDGFDYGITHVYKIKPNEIWFFGYKWNNSNTSYLGRPAIFKLDTVGNILSIKEFTNYLNYSNDKLFYDNISNRIYYACINYNTNPISSNLTCLDTVGNIIWNKPLSNMLMDLQVVNNELLVCGNKQVSSILSNGEHKLYFAKYNITTGNLISEKVYGKAFLQNVLRAIHILPNGQIVVVGSYSDRPLYNSLRHGGVILKIKPNGDSLWMRTYSNFNFSTYESFYDVKQTPDLGFIICGSPYSTPPPQNQSWVVKTDSLGVAPGMVTTGFETNFSIDDKDVSIYPNPSTGILNVELKMVNGLVTLPHEVKLINSLGQVVLIQTIKEDKTMLNIEHLPSGLYFVQIKTADGVLSKQFKIIKE